NNNANNDANDDNNNNNHNHNNGNDNDSFNDLSLEQLGEMDELELGYFCAKSGFSKEQTKSIVHAIHNKKIQVNHCHENPTPVAAATTAPHAGVCKREHAVADEHACINAHANSDSSSNVNANANANTNGNKEGNGMELTSPLWTCNTLTTIKQLEQHKSQLAEMMERLKYADESLEWRMEAEREEITFKMNDLIQYLQGCEQELLAYAQNLQMRAKLELLLLLETTSKQQQIVSNAIDMQVKAIQHCQHCSTPDTQSCQQIQTVQQDHLQALGHVDYATNEQHIQLFSTPFIIP
ncbi:hypothetical protein RFI_13421, partial [Reticulomyxa filosa]